MKAYWVYWLGALAAGARAVAAGLGDGAPHVVYRFVADAFYPTKAYPFERVGLTQEEPLLRVLDVAGVKILQLRGGAQIAVNAVAATLQDGEGNMVGDVDLLESSDALPPRRLLRARHSHKPEEPPKVAPALPPIVEGTWNSYPSEAYCRYGCGNLMGVTFPYYYRPFFGYGYPLIGTESLFRQGYGGNPVTQLGGTPALAQQNLALGSR